MDNNKTWLIVALILLASAGISYYIWFTPSGTESLTGFAPITSLKERFLGGSQGEPAGPEAPAKGVAGENAVVVWVGASKQLEGEITAIQGRSLTLTRNGDQMTVAVPEGVPIYKYGETVIPTPPMEEEELPAQTEEAPLPPMPGTLPFEELQVGNVVSISLQGVAFEDLRVVGIDVME